LASTGRPPFASKLKMGSVGRHIGRLLRKEVEEKVGKEKTPNPQKQKNKMIKQTKKEGE
jgi:hypothetical protein